MDKEEKQLFDKAADILNTDLLTDDKLSELIMLQTKAALIDSIDTLMLIEQMKMCLFNEKSYRRESNE